MVFAFPAGFGRNCAPVGDFGCGIMEAEALVIERASARFATKKSLYYYARGKMRHDPAYRVLANQLQGQNAPILDLGCGAGIFAAYLRESGVRAPICGVDLSEKKVRLAEEFVGVAYDGLSFRAADAGGICGFAGNIVGLDLLHYFSEEGRNRMLEQLVDSLPIGCRLYLRNGVKDAGFLRHCATSLEEAFVRGSRWITGGEWNFPTREMIEKKLASLGLRVVAVPMWGNTPFSSYLFVGSRR